jgi:hypothetical protein
MHIYLNIISRVETIITIFIQFEGENKLNWKY